MEYTDRQKIEMMDALLALDAIPCESRVWLSLNKSKSVFAGIPPYIDTRVTVELMQDGLSIKVEEDADNPYDAITKLFKRVSDQGYTGMTERVFEIEGG